MELYSALKRNSDSHYNSVYLKDSMLSEVSQSQKREIVCYCSYMRSPEESESQRLEVRWWGPGLGSQCFMGTVSVWEDEKILEMDGGGDGTTM